MPTCTTRSRRVLATSAYSRSLRGVLDLLRGATGLPFGCPGLVPPAPGPVLGEPVMPLRMRLACSTPHVSSIIVQLLDAEPNEDGYRYDLLAITTCPATMASLHVVALSGRCPMCRPCPKKHIIDTSRLGTAWQRRAHVQSSAKALA